MFKGVSIILMFVVVMGLSGCIGPDRNKPPSVAEITCPTTAKTGESVAVSVKAYDPDRNKIAYKVAFGDGVQSDWSDFLPSGQAKVFHHTYSRAGTFGIYAIASDHHHLNSGWSDKTFIKVATKESKWFAYYLSGNSIKVRTAPVTRTGNEINVPKDADWMSHGVVLSAGGSGSWDVRLTGALSPCTVVKKDGIYFLYYIGADGNRSFDGGPRHRALGVATSKDGLRFTKYSGNPILTYLPHNNEEEGIFSAGAFLDDNGEIILYYSALDAGSSTSTTVDSDVRLAISNNGLDFVDKGDVLSHADSKVWGYGDELFPVGAFREGSTYHVYYIAKGYGGAYWDLALARGSSRSNIRSNTKKVLDVGSDWAKSGCPVRLSANKIAVSICRNKVTEMRMASISSPDKLSSPVQRYSTRTGGVYID